MVWTILLICRLGCGVQPPSTNGSRVFRFDLSVTPFKPRNESQHWALRHFQVGYPSSAFTSAEDVAKTGATVVNIHQVCLVPLLIFYQSVCGV